MLLLEKSNTGRYGGKVPDIGTFTFATTQPARPRPQLASGAVTAGRAPDRARRAAVDHPVHRRSVTLPYVADLATSTLRTLLSTEPPRELLSLVLTVLRALHLARPSGRTVGLLTAPI